MRTCNATGTTVAFPSWDDTTGEEIMLVGVVNNEFTDPEERSPRPSYNLLTASGQGFTPYVDECRPARADEVAQVVQCSAGLHSWTSHVGKLPALAPCHHCHEFYGDPA